MLAAPGSKGASEAEEIVQVARSKLQYGYLEAQTYILGPDASTSDVLLEKLDGANAVVIMTDILWNQHPTAHKIFIDWCYQHPDKPVIGHVPKSEPRPRDFEFAIPDSSESGLGFLAHALLGRAITRGDLLRGWSQLLDTTAIGLGVALGVALVVAVALRRENGLYQRFLETPGAMQTQIVSALAKFRAGDLGAAAKPEVRTAKREMLRSIATAQMYQIDHISGVSRADFPRLMFHAPRRESGKTCLCEVASSGDLGGCLAADRESIAGCAFSQHIAVAWRGTGNRTGLIRAWRLDGRELKPDEFSCRFQPLTTDLPKEALLCIPLGVSDETKAMRPIGTICLSFNEKQDFLEESWLRALLLRTGNALSGMSFDGLVGDSARCSW